MAQKSLIYSFVVSRSDLNHNPDRSIRRDPRTVAEYAYSDGDFSEIAKLLVYELPISENNFFSFSLKKNFCYERGGLGFHYLVGKEYIFCVVAVKNFGDKIPTTFLQSIKLDFTKNYADNPDLQFGPILKQEMQNCYNQREDIRQDNTVKPPSKLEISADTREQITRVLDGREKFEIHRIQWFDKMTAKLVVAGVVTILTYCFYNLPLVLLQ